MKLFKAKALFIFLLVAFPFPFYCHALTLSDLRTELRRILKDSDSTRRQWTDAQLLSYLNEAQRDIVNATWLVQESTSRVLDQLTTYYTLTNDVIAVIGIEFKNSQGNVIDLDETTYDKLQADNPNWRNFNGAPVEYFIDQATTTNQLIVSYIPIPTRSSTGTVTVRYASQVDDLSADSDVPFNGRRELYLHHTTLVYHAAMKILGIMKKFNEALFYGQLYQNSVMFIKDKANAKPNYRPGFRAQ